MKVAVTGAGGFIGRHVLRDLVGRGIQTVAVLRAQDSVDTDHMGDKVVYLDIHQASADAYNLLGRPDVLIHLAWGGLLNYSALHHFESELPQHYRFLRTLILAGLPNLFVAGTCQEYGMQSGCLSEYLTTYPHTPYGFAKDALRHQLEFLGQEYDFSLTWGRLFYLYGEGQEHTLYAQIREAVRRGDKTFNMSGGEQLRDYLPVGEVARCIVELALAQKPVGVINICSGSPISVRRLVEDWKKQNQWSIDLNLGHYPYPEYEPMAFWGDRSKLLKYLQ